ncbi:GGDEF domain-containing protein, partial [bacterium]|nr:GGDEF domain-containing protein [bacterium]
LFHVLLENICILLNLLLFVIGNRTYKFSKNSAILVLSASFLFSSGLGFLHVLAYKGMNLISGIDSSMATQFWVARRYMESTGILFATMIRNRKLSFTRLMLLYFAATALLVALIFAKIFPVCFVEGIGLTPFKKISEYAIILISIITLLRLSDLNRHFETDYLKLFGSAIFFGILAEAMFTLYATVYDLANGIGHLFYLLSNGLFSIFVIKEGLDKPYTNMFHEVHRQAIRDSLTGLYNRNGFYEVVKSAFERAKRFHGGFRIFVIDLDNFKMINDRYGHPEGDRALVEFGKILIKSFREYDIIARFGGDEFIVILEGEGDAAELAQERLERAVIGWEGSNPKRRGLGISYGIAEREPGSEATIDSLLAMADEALLKAKAIKHPERTNSKRDEPWRLDRYAED